MAAGWLALLKLVPWSDVISAAPQVAGGAKKLWNTVAGKTPPADAVASATPEAGKAASTLHRIEQAEAALADLHKQMLSASEIIARLADQNTQLIARMEAMRVRLLWLGVTTGTAALVAIASLIVAATRA
jgi:hypothetical protein